MGEAPAIDGLHRDFSLLAGGLLISYVGDAFFLVGFMWLAMSISDNPGITGTVMAVAGLPPLLLGPLAGTRVQQEVDRAIQGRVFATLTTVSTASNPLGAALAGSALTMLQPDVVFRLVTLGLVAIYGALMLYQSAARARVQMPVSR